MFIDVRPPSHQNGWDRGRYLMARLADKLTAAGCRMTNTPGMYGDGKGLYLNIGPTGAKSWIFRYRAGKKADGKEKRHEMGLGPFPDVSLADARQKAQKHRTLLADYRHGEAELDPLAARQAVKQQRRVEAAKGMTFRQ